MTIKEYRNVEFYSSTARTPQYIQFEQACRRALKRQCKERSINVHKFNGNHFEWSAVLEKGGKFVYVRMSDVRWWDWYNDILIRTMAHAEDWKGGGNNKCSFDEIGEKADELFKTMDK